MTTQKKLYKNGKFVAVYDSTGDDRKDVELCIAILREKGLYTETTPAQAAFRQAVSFATTASYLYKRDLTRVPRNMASLSPFVVNGAFAIELYLKALALLHRHELRGHDLIDLFDALPSSAHSEIEMSFAACSWPTDIKDLSQLRIALDGMRRAFIRWRYIHEWNDDDEGSEIRIVPMIVAMEVLHHSCRIRLDRRPAI